MWFDVILGVMILACVIGGYKNGLVHSFLRTAGWLLSLILSFAWYPMIAQLIKEKTGLYDALHTSIASKTAETAWNATDQVPSNFPTILKDAAHATGDSLGNSLATTMTDFLFSIASLLLIFFGIKLIFFMLRFLFSKKNNDGLTGCLDGMLGAAFGAITGILLLLTLLALFVPLRELVDVPSLWNGLDHSTISLWLYNKNPLLHLSTTLLSSNLS